MTSLWEILNSGFFLLTVGTVIIPLAMYLFSRERDRQREKDQFRKEKADLSLTILYRYDVMLRAYEECQGFHDDGDSKHAERALKRVKDTIVGGSDYAALAPDVDRSGSLIPLVWRWLPIQETSQPVTPAPINHLSDILTLLGYHSDGLASEWNSRYDSYESDLKRLMDDIEMDRNEIAAQLV